MSTLRVLDEEGAEKQTAKDWRKTGGWTVLTGEKNVRLWSALREMLATGHMMLGLESELCVWQRGGLG